MDMILKTVLAAIVLYYAALFCEYCYHEGIPFLLNRKKNGTGKGTGTEEMEETARETLSVIGKSTYRKRQRNEPKDKQGTAENQADKTDNFAAGTPVTDAEKVTNQPTTEPKTDVQVATETGTQTNDSDVPDDDADYSDIDAEPDESEGDVNEPEAEYVPTPEELEEEEELAEHYPDHAPDCATGYSFEDLQKLQRVLVKDVPDEEEKQQARDVLPSLMGSDIYDKMLDEFDGARQRVALLMNNEV